MSVTRGLIVAGVVGLNAMFGSKATAQDCDTSWANAYSFLNIPPQKWNFDLIASMGPQNAALLASEVNSSIKTTLDTEVGNIFDGINDAVVNDRDIDWKYYKESYNPIFTPVLVKAEADMAKEGADKTSVLAAARNQGTLAVVTYVGELATKLLSLPADKTVCADRPAATP